MNNRLKVNSNSNSNPNNPKIDLRVGLSHEFNSRLINRKLLLNENNLFSIASQRRTPSPPKSRVLMTTTQYNQMSNTSANPLVSGSQPKSCYTGWSVTSDLRPTPGQKTPDCERRLKRLERSGLLAKFANFQITKTIPLAEEEEDNEEDEQNDVVFITHNQTIELKSSEEFEPNFVSQIKEEVRKLSSQSFGSQSCSQRSRSNGECDKELSKKRSLNGCKSQPNPPIAKKLPPKPSASQPKVNIYRKSKSNDNLVVNKEIRKDVTNKPKSEDKVDKNSKERRSHSSNGRLNSCSDKPNDNKNDGLCGTQSHPNAEHKSSNNESKRSNKSENSGLGSALADNSTSNREKSIRKIKVNHKYYQILNCIGQGGSSKVYQVYDPELQMTLAIKIVDLSRVDEQTVIGYKNEITLLSKLRKCKRVVRMYDYEYQNNGQQLLVVMEKGDSDLSNVLKSFIESEDRRSLDPHLIRFYWQQMLKAVDEIHAYGVVHSDLKPVNFILVAGKLKLIDFGIANAIQANTTSVYKESQIGTINYMAPEALQNRSEVKGKTVIKYNCKADIWSLGCILYNLVYGITPFHHLNNLFQKANAILDPSHQINYPAIDDPLLLDCIQKCLRRDPNKRPTTEELLNHRYLTELKAPAVSATQNALISQINDLTPNRFRQLSQVIEKLAKK